MTHERLLVVEGNRGPATSGGGDGEHPAAPLGLEWPPLPQTTASMPRSGGSHPVTSLPQALARLRGDDSEEARRIREAETLVKRGNQIEIRKLCTTDAGWGVSRRVNGKVKPQAELKKELRNKLLAAARRHLATVGLHHIGEKERGKEGTPERKAQESLPEALAQASLPATLEEALDRLRGDDAEQAVRIRGAAAVVEEGNKSQIEALCTRGAGWNVQLRASSQKKATAVLKTELQSQILVAARRHLSSVQAAPSSSSAASAPMAAAPATVVQPEGGSASARMARAKRLLDTRPDAEDAKRIRTWLEELDPEPPRKKLRDLAAAMTVPQKRGETEKSFYARICDTAIKAAHDDQTWVRRSDDPSRNPLPPPPSRTRLNCLETRSRSFWNPL